jgi:hypothetical protein
MVCVLTGTVAHDTAAGQAFLCACSVTPEPCREGYNNDAETVSAAVRALPDGEAPTTQHSIWPTASGSRIAKATVVYPRSPILYTTAPALHEKQNKQFGYNMHILRQPILKGGANILYWLVSLIVSELQRDLSKSRWNGYCTHLCPSVYSLF